MQKQQESNSEIQPYKWKLKISYDGINGFTFVGRNRDNYKSIHCTSLKYKKLSHFQTKPTVA